MLKLFHRYKKTAVPMLLASCLLYFYFMIHQLTNAWDGFWQQSYYQAGDWEISCGRWLWPLLDRLHLGIHLDPYTTIAALIFYTAGMVFIFDLFDTLTIKKSILAGLLFLSSPVVSAAISYRFIAIVYGAAFLSSVLAVMALVWIRKPIISAACAILCVFITMSLYQAYLGCICVLILIYAVMMLHDRRWRFMMTARFLIRSAVSFVAGGLLYSAFLKVYLAATGRSMTSYIGADSITIGSILSSLPQSVVKAYRLFFDFYSEKLFMSNAFGLILPGVFFLLLLFIPAVLILIRAARISVYRGCLCALLFLAAPLAANVTFLLAPESVFMPQGAVGCALFLPLLYLCVGSGITNWDSFYKEHSALLKPAAAVFGTVCVLVFYGQSLQVITDHNAMYEGRNASVSMMTQVVDDLKDAGVRYGSQEIFFIGRPSDNSEFSVSELYYRANEYAQVGNFWLSDNNMTASYDALLNKVMGIRASVQNDAYESKSGDEYFRQMPSYPNPGYIVVWDTVIVKISEP